MRARHAVARERGAGIMLLYGAHLLRNGAALILERMMSQGWLTHRATNAGIATCPRTLHGSAITAYLKNTLKSCFFDELLIDHQPSPLPGFLHHKKALLIGLPGLIHRGPDGPAEEVVPTVDVW